MCMETLPMTCLHDCLHAQLSYTGPHCVFERNMLTADLLEPQVPLRAVAPNAVIQSRVWTDLSETVEERWTSQHWTEDKSLGFNLPPCSSNFALMKYTGGEAVQRETQIDLWALGFSPCYLDQYQPDFLAVIQ